MIFDLHFGTFVPKCKNLKMILIYILELLFQNVKFENDFDLHFGTFVPKCKLFSSLEKKKVPKCKLFSFTNWNFLFFQPCKIFPRPNSGDKKNEILHFGIFSKIWRRFLSQIIFFKNFFEMKYILKSFIP